MNEKRKEEIANLLLESKIEEKLNSNNNNNKKTWKVNEKKGI